MLRNWLALVVLILLVGCDRAPSPSRQQAAAPGRTVVQFRPITQLPPGRTVHIAVDALGNIFYAFETDNGHDGVVVVGAGSIPRATQLTSANILAAMGETVGGSGAIQDLAPAPGGGIFFYFIGGKARSVRACLGYFDARSEAIRVQAGTDQLTRLSGMGASIDLARGSILPMGSRMGLLMRHMDAWVLLGFDARTPGPGIDLNFTRLLDKIEIADPRARHELNLTDPRFQVSPGPDGNLLLMDRTSGELWQVDRGGKAMLRNVLTGLPRELSQPLVQQDHLLIFAADSEPIVSDVSDVLTMRRLPVAYPALLLVKGNDITATGRDDLRLPSGFPVYALRIGQLISAADDTFVGYDSSSGQLMRLRRTTEHE